MAGSYDDRDGVIWMDGALLPWREANVHILTHAMHYASSVFEGERCYNGRIFKSREHSERLKISATLIDFEIPYSIDEIEAAKDAGAEGQRADRRLCARARLARVGGGHGRVVPPQSGADGGRRLGLGQLLRRREDEGREARHREVAAARPGDRAVSRRRRRGST
jgi:branched-subunit amino acid aminotransferase/4-amino-4-deoxychorismate lyase